MYPGSCVYDAGIAGYFEKVVFEARFDKSKVLTAIDNWNYDKYSNCTVLAARHEKIQLVAKALEAKTQKFDGVVYISLLLTVSVLLNSERVESVVALLFLALLIGMLVISSSWVLSNRIQIVTHDSLLSIDVGSNAEL